MMKGLDHLFKAARTLGDNEAPFLDRFRSAVDDFWAAAFAPEEWPPHLLDRVDSTVDRILTLRLRESNPAGIDDAAVKAIAEEILRLANELPDRPGPQAD